MAKFEKIGSTPLCPNSKENLKAELKNATIIVCSADQKFDTSNVEGDGMKAGAFGFRGPFGGFRGPFGGFRGPFGGFGGSFFGSPFGFGAVASPLAFGAVATPLALPVAPVLGVGVPPIVAPLGFSTWPGVGIW